MVRRGARAMYNQCAMFARQRIRDHPGKVYVRLPGKKDSNTNGARSVHPIITMIKCIWTGRSSIKNALSLHRNNIPRCMSLPCNIHDVNYWLMKSSRECIMAKQNWLIFATETAAQEDHTRAWPDPNHATTTVTRHYKSPSWYIHSTVRNAS